MINVLDKLFFLTTQTTSYLFHVTEEGHLEHLYYGKRLSHLLSTDIDALKDKHHINIGTEPCYNEDNPAYFLENISLETSTEGRGDYRIPMVVAEYGQGLSTLDFVYKSHTLTKGKPIFHDGNAQAYGTPEDSSTLAITLTDKKLPITLTLYYTTFDTCDVILRKAVLSNDMEGKLLIRNLSSLQLDLFDDNWDLITFDGAWSRERIMDREPLRSGTHVNESRTGLASSDHNPLVYLARPDATESHGLVIASNLIYSGNHKESIEVSPFGKTRLLTGINDSLFAWTLNQGESFGTPEAVLTCSEDGCNGASDHFHLFVNAHIIRGEWRYRERPILVNSWEASYFDINEDKLYELAKQGHDLGCELFVIDDGWFSGRDDDTSSLGDWYPSPSKFPSGLATFSRKVHDLDMMFGIWIEPETVNKKSILYGKHPDWMIAIPGREPVVCRHEHLLDLTKKEVCDYLFKSISEILDTCSVDYVKWDMNTVFADLYSFSVSDMREYPHRYVMALYGLLERFIQAFPHILWEGCASGGNRFDLGMLCYFSQIWVSDNTDAFSRTAIQGGTSYGYPPSTMGCHVSNSPNPQTLRISPIDSRFNVACFGDLGYELDLTELGKEEKTTIAEQISFFKLFRPIFQFGTFHRYNHDSIIQWTSISNDKRTMATLWMQPLNPSNAKSDRLFIEDAEEDAVYDVFPRSQRIPLSLFGHLLKTVKPLATAGETVQKVVSENLTLPSEVEHYTVSGSVLKHAGIKLNQQFSGTGRDSQTRVFSDFGSRLYLIKKH